MNNSILLFISNSQIYEKENSVMDAKNSKIYSSWY